MLNVCDFGPEVFNGVVKIPGDGEGGAIVFELFGGKSTIFTPEMLQHGARGKVTETKDGIFQRTQKGWVDSVQYLGCKGSTEIVV